MVNTRSLHSKLLRPVSFLNRHFKGNLKANVIEQPVIIKDIPDNQVWMLTSYPPRECGIATFSADLKNALETKFGESIQLKIAAIDNGIERISYPREVSFIFHSDASESFEDLASIINNNKKAKALVIQHEFGLFQQNKQAEFLNMLNSIDKPVILVMHTVLPTPPQWMKESVATMIDAADKVVVMTKHSAGLLRQCYNIPASKISVIPHGTHLPPAASKETLKEKYGLNGRTVLSTFGLISRNKSIETSIKALPAIVKNIPKLFSWC